jgi:hypothetical protein
MAYDYQDNNRDPMLNGKHAKISESPDALSRPMFESDLRSSHLLNSTQEMEVYAKSINVDDNSQRSYIRYCDDSIEPEIYIEEKSSGSEYDFEKSVQALSVDNADVRGMEELAASSYISDVIATGQYEGMLQAESALLATALTSATLVFVEPHLQVEAPEPSSPPRQGQKQMQIQEQMTPGPLTKHSSVPLPSSSSRSSSFSDHSSLHVTPNKSDFTLSPDEKVPAMQKEQSLINKRASTRYLVELTDDSKNKMDDIWQANTNFSQVGLEEKIHSNLNKYLYSQHIYGQEVDPDRLAKR